MKKINLILAISISIISLLTSCEKEENTSSGNNNNNNNITNYLIYNGQKYPLEKCFILDVSFPTTTTYNFKVALTSKSITYNSFLNLIEGTGTGFVFDIITATSSYVGSFEMDTVSTYLEPGDIGYSHIVVNEEFTLSPTHPIVMKRGSASISMPASNTYLITGTFKDENKKVATIYYKGEVIP